MNHITPTISRVCPKHIEDLKARVHYRTAEPDGTTSTFVHAYLDGRFFLGSGHSACVDPANFDTTKGMVIAKRNAEALVEQKLWELEGYAFYKSIS